MQKRALLAAPLLVSVAAAAAVAPRPVLKQQPVARDASGGRVAMARYQPSSQPRTAPAVAPQATVISQAISQWYALRQSDNLPFSSYASFLTRYRGWPGESGLRRAAERAADPATTPAPTIVSYFSIMPPLSATGHARHALALHASGQTAAAREAARSAWRLGSLSAADETRLLSLFGTSFTPDDHNMRIEALLANGETTAAARLIPYSSPARRPIFEARLAMKTRAPDAAAKLALLGPNADTDANVLMDRANWLRDTGQSQAARALLAKPRNLAIRPAYPEKWFETLLTMARGAANDKQWTLAYQIASQIDDAYPPGTVVSAQPLGERDDYTSLAWLAGTTALHRLGRASDAAAMFVRYAHGGRSAQVLTKGMYWAGRAAQAANRSDLASSYFAEAARYPELFYGQLALERVGAPVPAPVSMAAVASAMPAAAAATGTAVPAQPGPADRDAFLRRDIVQATQLLGQWSRWNDQSLFVRALSQQADTDRDRILVAEFSSRIRRPDLAVWVARDARNAGSPFYVREVYPQVRIPQTASQHWSLAHGIIRQESSFDRAAVSHAGARGMMQLMPATAKATAGRMSLSYSLDRLTSDPDYNIMLGSHYFARLMEQWGGYAPLAIASYNAGPGNVRKWVAANGDPRTSSVDVVRWIEEIPFAETRGYVQRVLENAVVYDALNPAQARTPPSRRLSHYLGKAGRPG